MKRLIILTDGMADYPIAALGNKTPLMAVKTPNMDRIAREGVTGLFETVPPDMIPGSEVANLAIIGYDPRENFCRRGVLEAASLGVTLKDTELAIRCNLIYDEDRVIKSHSCGDIEHETGEAIIALLNERLGSDRVHFHTGTHYRHLLVIDGGKAAINCWPPHDHLETPVDQLPVTATAPEGEETAAMLNQLVEASRSILAEIPWVKEKAARHERRPTSIWPWAAGEKPHMIPIKELTGLSGATITAVDLIKGLGIYAGMTPIHVEGATGNWQTNYEGKAAAAIEALKTYDYIYLHVEAADEAGHDGDMKLKMSVIEDLDSRLIAPIMKHIDETGLDIRIALLPDHPTPVETRLHTKDPVPVAIWGSGITADDVTTFDEESVKSGRLGLLDQKAFFHHFFQ